MGTKLKYDKLRVRLRRESRLAESDVLWGKRLSRTKWTIFERGEVHDGAWMGMAWEVIKRDDVLRIEGKRDRRWEAVSTWLVRRRQRKASGAVRDPPARSSVARGSLCDVRSP
jgi:hypothetical protein